MGHLGKILHFSDTGIVPPLFFSLFFPILYSLIRIWNLWLKVQQPYCDHEEKAKEIAETSALEP